MKLSEILPTAWQSEVNGLGYCYRSVSCIPSWFPLPFMGQHGAQFNLGLPVFDRPNHYPVYVSWHTPGIDFLRNNYSKDVRCICNPICAFHRSRKLTQNSNASGTIHFLSHSGEDFDRKSKNLDSLFHSLNQLSATYKPITICLHPNDYQQYAPQCEAAGIKFVTNDASTPGEFVERLFHNLMTHKYVSGEVNQSAVMYAIDFGLVWIGDNGDRIDEDFWGNRDSDYIDDPYANSISSVLNSLVNTDDGNLKIRSIVRAHLGTACYKSQLHYALIIWSFYFDIRLMRVIIRNIVRKHRIY